ncbi:MAG: zinc ribbon domain-containing protein [Victivallales bacterium]|nr:zinc ribbon domain-containing protein [Victivallales bacterium]
MFCSKCGCQLDDASRFCSQCGASIGPVADASTSTETPIPAPALAADMSEKKPERIRLGVIGKLVVSILAGVVALGLGIYAGLLFVGNEDGDVNIPALMGPSKSEIKRQTASLIRQIVAENGKLKDYVTFGKVQIVLFDQLDKNHYQGTADVRMTKKGSPENTSVLVRYEYETTLTADEKIYVQAKMLPGEDGKVKRLVGMLNWLKLNF